jgi:uncharacterized membrane protein
MISLPTLHPATVHFPIALLMLASAAGLLYLWWRPREELRTLCWWPMGLGWIGGVIAALTGLLAQAGLPPQAPYRALLNWHIGSGLGLLVVYGLLLYLHWLRRPTRRQRQRTPSPPPLLDDPGAKAWFSLLLLGGLVLIVASGWNGGRLVYEWGVNVAR